MAHTEVSAQTVESYSEGLNQITNVNQLRDVSPTDWAYEALRSLVDRYGCISGKSDHSGHGHDDHGHDEEKEAQGHSEHLHGAAKGKLSFVIDAVGGEFNEDFANYNEYFSEELTGAISRFGRFDPIYYQGLEGTGATVNYNFSDAIALSVGYLAPRASEPLEGAGLFNGSFAAIAQASIQPTDSLGFGLTYSRGYYAPGELVVSGETGSETANAPFGEEIPTSADHFGIQGKYELSGRLSVSAWGGLSLANAQTDMKSNYLLHSHNIKKSFMAIIPKKKLLKIDLARNHIRLLDLCRLINFRGFRYF